MPAPQAVDRHSSTPGPAPRYPRQSLRDGHAGTVTLRVRVDEYGQPQEVVIERSSGHHELDRAARELSPLVRQVTAVADAAIVGSAFVRLCGESGTAGELAQRILLLAKELKAATKEQKRG